MYTPDCRAYLRHDRTASTKQIRLTSMYWSVIQAKQEELAEELGVPRVSRPVALRHILDAGLKLGICHHKSINQQEK